MRQADAVIIGGGPAGLSAAINGIYRKKTVRLFSSEKNYLERAELVNNYLGMEEISGRDMMQQFRQQVARRLRRHRHRRKHSFPKPFRRTLNR